MFTREGAKEKAWEAGKKPRQDDYDENGRR